MGDKTERTCERWYGGCDAPATKSVQAVGERAGSSSGFAGATRRLSRPTGEGPERAR